MSRYGTPQISDIATNSTQPRRLIGTSSSSSVYRVVGPDNGMAGPMRKKLSDGPHSVEMAREHRRRSQAWQR